MTTTQAEKTLRDLSNAENFRAWEFGKIEKAVEYLKAVPDGRLNIPEPNDPRWTGEPDKVQWIDPFTGYDCLIVRNPMGALCGYVGVPPGHSLHGVDYGACPQADDCPERDRYCNHSPESVLSVHGGITFSDFCDPSEADDAICHTPAPGRPDKVFWFGFDCAHAGDLCPGSFNFTTDSFRTADTYRDLTYVRNEVQALAVQLEGRSSAR